MRNIKFKTNRQSNFYQELNQRVQSYFNQKGMSKKANGWMIIKLGFCFFLFFGLYVLILTFPLSLNQYLLFTLLFGLASALLVFNIGHDALHGALFHSKPLNRLFGYSFELAGMSSVAWHLKHNVVHHLYPNVIRVDFDIDAWPIMRLSPADKLLYPHRFQHVYAPLAYTMFSLLLVFFNDFRILYFRKKLGDGKRHTATGWLVSIMAKTLYLFFMVLLPTLVLPVAWWQVVIGFLAMHAVLSLGICLILIPSHLFEHTVYLPGTKVGQRADWARHQLESTIDYSSDSRLANFLFGGLNTNVAHHLFPRVCHVHLISVTRIVKQTAKEYGITYHETSLPGAISSHFKMLKLLGRKESVHRLKS